MIKLSKDNLVIWKILFPGMLTIVHLFLIVAVLNMNFWIMYAAYIFIALMQFIVGGVWKYPLLEDVYLNEDRNSITIEPLYDKKIEILLANIVKEATYFGITSLTTMAHGVQKTIYFKANSNENLKFLKPR